MNGITVNAAASDVVRIRNLTLDGTGGSGLAGLNGIRFLAGGTLFVENVRIYDNNATTPNGHGINFIPSGNSRLVVTDTIINNNQGGGGILIKPGAAGLATVAIDNARISGNLFGLRADDRSAVTVRNSAITNNTNSGVLAFSAGAAVELTVENSMVSNNGIGNPSAAGIKSEGALASIQISNNVITNNQNGLLTASGGDLLSFGNNKVIGNTTEGNPTGSVATR